MNVICVLCFKLNILKFFFFYVVSVFLFLVKFLPTQRLKILVELFDCLIYKKCYITFFSFNCLKFEIIYVPNTPK